MTDTLASLACARWAACVAFALTACSRDAAPPAIEDAVFSPAVFAAPPRALGPQARWWWPGGSVDDQTLGEELQQLAELGYGAVELQPFMAALTNADLREDSRIRTVGSPSFLARLRTAACAARDLGLAWDLTLGSGWSTGGPDVGADGARQLLLAEQTLVGPEAHQGPLPEPEPPDWIRATNAIVPAIDGFDEDVMLVAVLAAEVLDASADEPATLGDVVDLEASVEGNLLTWQVPEGTHRVFAIYENRTQYYPLGNAYAAPVEQARIIDHLDRRGVDGFLRRQLDAWISAVGDCVPRAVFVDSFELAGELPWTTSFGSAFASSVGYDVTPFLPFLFLDGGEAEYVNIFRESPQRYRGVDERGERAREDYEAFRGERFADEMLAAVDSWLAERGIDLRLQAHGGYADVLDAYALADVPESEGLYAGGSYDFLRLAASAAEVTGKRFASSETLVTVGALELTIDEVRLLFGRAFSAGINRLVLHGHAYPYAHTDGVRWFPFQPRPDSAVTAGPAGLSFNLSPEADVWDELPALNEMAARVGYAMSRGSAVTEVAWLYPTWKAENFPNFGVEPGRFESEPSRELRQAGFTYTRVSRAALARSEVEAGALSVGDASFAALLISELQPVDPSVLAAIDAAAAAGVPVIWLGPFPSRADGLVDAQARDAAVTALVESLRSRVIEVASPREIATALIDAGVSPPLEPADVEPLRISLAHRRVRGGDVYYLFNESYEARAARLRLPPELGSAALFDPDTGRQLSAAPDGGVLTVQLEAVRGAVLVIERSSGSAAE